MASLISIFSYVLVLLRAATLCFQTLAVGGILFLLLVARNKELRVEELMRPAWKLMRWSAVAFAIAQVLFMVSNSLVLTSSVNISLKDVLGANYVLAGLLGVMASLAIAYWPVALRQSMNSAVLLPAATMVAATVMTSHAASRMEERALLISLTSLHYLTTASWIGGLPFLLLAMKRVSDVEVKARISRNFSRLAQISVALLFSAGLTMGWIYLGSWNAVYGTAYGIMVSAKVALFGCLVLLGAANYYIVKGIGKEKSAGTRSLVRFGEVEVGLGLAVILTATSLTSQPPGVDLTEDRVSWQEIAQRYSPRMPRLSSPEWKELSESTQEMLKKAAAAGQSVPVSFVPGQFAAGTNGPADRAWSEYNHNWAGLIVFLMGILALLSRSRYLAWAKVWPLAFLGLAVFLFLRADPENWPLGPNGFWASFGEAEVLQHRLAVLLLIAFAAFQYLVEVNKLKSPAAALVFPVVCILGGMILLTHSHALGNIKEELLAEMNHTPLAIFGLLAGWSRWLELRLPQENNAKKYLSWVWPVCFIMVGLLLMDYHES
jgi:copper resistance protein D